ncbi:hypothetical protein [Rhizobium leguminosarum]|uniref:hypothetical protein n=1 Tax=Rhizobium leguminosarum TaxID=384 RepID=UPI001C94B0C2|nr:hypothetical protein [Rhizobium leguminosarum]MBY5346026.1 hypothetical protein [Rhizobium leguminosarum]
MNNSNAVENKGGPAPVGPALVTVSSGDLSVTTGIKPASACRTYIAADQFLQDEKLHASKALEASRQTISAARLKRYLTAADDDLRTALRLHAWNAAVAGSLLPTLHLAEVTIRNFALKRLIAKYGKHWYNNSTLLDYRLSKKLAGELREAAQRELDLGRRGNLSDYITSELTFGFWVNVFTKTFQPDLWHAPLHSVLPGFPRGKTIVDLHDGVEFVRTFRNNVAHHKNIVFKPVVENYERTLKVTGLICGATKAMAESLSTFPAIWAGAPVPIAKLRAAAAS